jgi:hypothetical protein
LRLGRAAACVLGTTGCRASPARPPKRLSTMRSTPLLAIAAAAALAAGAAAAQSSDETNNQSNAAPSTSQAGAPTAPTTYPGGVTSSPTPADQAYTLKAGDPNVITNGPVPDTPENRKLYGGPMSNGGRHTAPKGN